MPETETWKHNDIVDALDRSNEFLRRIHFWIQMWSVLTVVGIAIWLVSLVVAAETASNSF